ncbi:hypothetical protein ACJX0J_031990, partial [Zea mays]
EVRSGSEGYVIKMRDGKNLCCVHSNFQGRNIPESAPQPTIVLRIEDGSRTLLLIIVLEMPSVLLMAAIRNVHNARATIYQVVKEMIDKMGYEVKLISVNKRIQEAYCAELYLTKKPHALQVNDPTDNTTFDLQPLDAINISVHCKDGHPSPTPWPERFHAVLFTNLTNYTEASTGPPLRVTDLYYDWPRRRNLNLVRHQLSADPLYDVEWNNGTGFYFDSKACRVEQFPVGVLPPWWLSGGGAEYVGRRVAGGIDCHVWGKAGFIFYYEEARTGRPVRWDFVD